jgi:Amt family ammonium transporter
LFGRQAGFAMINAGMVREKNVNNALIKSLLDACTGSVAFWALGYAFAFGGEDATRKSFIGNQNFFLRNYRDGYNQLILFYFQVSFAQNASTVVTGVLGGRSKMGSHFVYSTFITAFVYPVIVHNIWSKSGYLSPFNEHPFRGVGAIDYGGSGVVHITGGVAGLIGAVILGPRMGRFHDENGKPFERPAYTPMYSPSFVVLGTFILWVGWCVFLELCINLFSFESYRLVYLFKGSPTIQVRRLTPRIQISPLALH